MNKALVISVLASSMFLTACDQFKQKKDETAQAEDTEWSCTNQNHLKDLQGFLKAEYLKELDKSLRSSKYYAADETLLKTINDS